VSVDDPIIGKLGTVTHAITPGRAGEIVVHIRGGTETYMAVADTEVPEETQVLVVGQRTARTVEVMPFIG
jgi:membrane protein implicated in regulation of membrane protease activity